MKISIYNAEPGMILEKNVYGKNNGNPIMIAGNVLGELDLNRLKMMGLKYVSVKTKNKIEENSTIELYEDIKSAIDNLDYNKLMKLSKEMVTKIINNPYPVLNLNTYFEIDEEEFEHVFNVCMMAAFIGNVYNKEQVYQKDMISLENIVAASLFQTIGKKCIDKKVFNSLKPLELNQTIFPFFDKEVFKNYDKHYYNLYSYSMINDKIDIPSVIKNSIIYLKEREDGKGLLGVSATDMEKNDEKIIIAKIIQVATQYDFLLNYIVKNNINLSNIPIILKQLAQKNGLDQDIVTMFENNIPLYAKGTRVELSNGEIAYVEEINIKQIDKPIVKTEDTNEVIDLSKNTDLTVRKIVQLEIENQIEENYKRAV